MRRSLRRGLCDRLDNRLDGIINQMYELSLKWENTAWVNGVYS